MTTCARHPTQRAAWRCCNCGKTLCPTCAYSDRQRGEELIRCSRCDGLAELLTVQTPPQPYWTLPVFSRLILAIFSVEGAIQLLAVAVVLTLLPYIPFGGLLAAGVYIGYYFLIIRKAAMGSDRLPAPDDFSDWLDDIVLPFFRFMLASSVLWVPALIYIVTAKGMVAISAPRSLLTDPVLLLIIAASLLYFPGAMITAAVTESTWSTINPLVIVGIVLRIPAQYVLTVAIWGGLTVVNLVLVGPLKALLVMIPIPILPSIVAGMIGLVLPFLTALIMGRLVYQNSEKLGLGRQDGEMVPLMPNAVPTGSQRGGGGMRPLAQGKPEAAGPIAGPQGPTDLPLQEEVPWGGDPSPPGSGSPADVVGRGEGSRFEPGPKWADPAPRAVEAQPMKAPPPPNVTPLMKELVAALDAKDDSRAERIVRELTAEGAAPDLEPRHELQLAVILEKAGDTWGAVSACRRAAGPEPGSRLAARAIFTAGRLLEERLAERARAATMYHHLVRNLPSSPFAARALERLHRMGA